jgi:hypothetical protein
MIRATFLFDANLFFGKRHSKQSQQDEIIIQKPSCEMRYVFSAVSAKTAVYGRIKFTVFNVKLALDRSDITEQFYLR